MFPITLLFFSSSDISLPLFEALLSKPEFKILATFCQPDKPAGRRLFLKKPHIKEIAEKNEIPVYQPENLSEATVLLEKLKSESPDFILTFAYGKILNEKWLNVPKIAPLNVHASLLPKYRGSSPIQSAILNGEQTTGISLMKMVEAFDTGPIYSSHSITLKQNWSASFIQEALAQQAAEKTPQDLIELSREDPPLFKEQDSGKASMTKKIRKDDGYLNFRETAEQIYKKFLAYSDWPGVWSFFKSKRLKFLDLKKSDEVLAPGEVLCKNRKLFIGTLDGSIEILQLQMEGRNRIHADQFTSGTPDICSVQLPHRN